MYVSGEIKQVFKYANFTDQYFENSHVANMRIGIFST